MDLFSEELTFGGLITGGNFAFQNFAFLKLGAYILKVPFDT